MPVLLLPVNVNFAKNIVNRIPPTGSPQYRVSYLNYVLLAISFITARSWSFSLRSLARAEM